jgi:hypothetical protein
MNFFISLSYLIPENESQRSGDEFSYFYDGQVFEIKLFRLIVYFQIWVHMLFQMHAMYPRIQNRAENHE